MSRRGLWLLVGVVVAAGPGCGNSSSGPGGTSVGAAGTVAGSGGNLASASGASGSGNGAGTGGTADSGTGGVAAPGTGGVAAMSGVAGRGGLPGAGGVAEGLCPEMPAPRLTSGGLVELSVELALGGAPLLFAEANPLPGGGTLTPLGVRFYISEVALLREGMEPLPVDIVTPTGAVAPYNVYFFNGDDDASHTLRVLAPVGDYQGVQFLWGLAQPCNTRSPDASLAPLSATSGMTWPHTGYLFFRYEGRTAFPGTGGGGAGGGAAAGGSNTGGATAGGASEATAGAAGGAGISPSLYPPAIHMGGNLFMPLAPLVRIESTFNVLAAGPVQRRLRVAMEQVFEGAVADVDLTDFVGPPDEKVRLGEALRRSLPGLTVFSLDP